MSNKREREYERRRMEKWQARHAEAVRRRRRRIVAGSVVGALVLVIGVVAAVVANNADDATPAAYSTDTPSPDATQPPVDATPTAAPTNSELVPDPALAEGRTWTGEIDLNAGPLQVSLDGAAAPQAVANFVTAPKDSVTSLVERPACASIVAALVISREVKGTVAEMSSKFFLNSTISRLVAVEIA